jgi:hypothetical protein
VCVNMTCNPPHWGWTTSCAIQQNRRFQIPCRPDQSFDVCLRRVGLTDCSVLIQGARVGLNSRLAGLCVEVRHALQLQYITAVAASCTRHCTCILTIISIKASRAKVLFGSANHARWPAMCTFNRHCVDLHVFHCVYGSGCIFSTMP